jgi:hypothetical protein
MWMNKSAVLDSFLVKLLANPENSHDYHPVIVNNAKVTKVRTEMVKQIFNDFAAAVW